MRTKSERIDEFIEIMSEAIDSESVNELASALDALGFFEAPASTKYHGNYPGGLFDHSLYVTKALVNLTKKLRLHWQEAKSPYIVGMLHDLCKVDNYIQQEDGTYTYDNSQIIPGHGEKSIIYIQSLMRLNEEEIACIRWHMGAFDEKENWNRYGQAIEKYPNVLWTHTADMVASRIYKI